MLVRHIRKKQHLQVAPLLSVETGTTPTDLASSYEPVGAEVLRGRIK
ncbi:MAG: hypothetical protein ACI89X_002381 [Planctomycetota bacterium]|jgi:hypothetical protein